MEQKKKTNRLFQSTTLEITMKNSPPIVPTLQYATRRTFLKHTAAGGLVAVSGILGSTLASFGRSAPIHINPLKIPTLDTGNREGNQTVYNLNIQNGTTEFFNNVKTVTRGINGSYLGPTLRLKNGDDIKINVKNTIGEATTIHWHGMHLPAIADGGPHQPIANNETWSAEFKVKQKAANFWYHSHGLHKTAEHVWQGIAGMIIVDDAESSSSDLPGEYGIDDIPVVLQDRIFSNNGQMYYDPSRPEKMMGLIGNTPLANGTTSAFIEAKSQFIRLRLLNGSNASIYNLGFSDNRPFLQIGTDGGLLETPYKTDNIVLAPAERAEIIVDVSGNENIMLQSRASSGSGGMMGMGGMMGRGMGGMMGGSSGPFDFLEIRPAANLALNGAIPDTLTKIEWIDPSKSVNNRKFEMEMTMGPLIMLGIGNSHTINGKAMKMSRIDEVVKRDTTEIWEISNTSPLPHPFHIHDVQFQIIDRSGRPPHPGERGLKDTVLVNPGEVVRIALQFTDYSDANRPYMYHCHILEHEDAGMMGQFTVV